MTLAALPDARRILAAVARYTSVSESDILSDTHRSEVVAARMLAIYVIQDETQLSWSAVTRLLGFDASSGSYANT